MARILTANFRGEGGKSVVAYSLLAITAVPLGMSGCASVPNPVKGGTDHYVGGVWVSTSYDIVGAARDNMEYSLARLRRDVDRAQAAQVRFNSLTSCRRFETGDPGTETFVCYQRGRPVTAIKREGEERVYIAPYIP